MPFINMFKNKIPLGYLNPSKPVQKQPQEETRMPSQGKEFDQAVINALSNYLQQQAKAKKSNGETPL